MTERRPQPQLRGNRLVVAAIAVLFVTVFLPPVAAWRLNMNRLRETQQLLSIASAYLRAHLDALAADDQTNGILRGIGRLPFGSDGAPGEWVRRAIRSPESFGVGEPDAWGRCIFVDLEGLRLGRPVLLLSAGPNMIVETPPGSRVLGGDDIGVLIK